jgi:hypothetical protein
MTLCKSPAEGGTRPRVLVCGDDSITAPGLRELVRALGACQACDVFVCAPIDERSATSHAITLSPALSGISCDVPGASEAFAVHGTPADCVLLALCAPVFTYQVGSRGIFAMSAADTTPGPSKPTTCQRRGARGSTWWCQASTEATIAASMSCTQAPWVQHARRPAG